MKLASTILSLGVFGLAAEACITAHVHQANSVMTGDGASAHVFDNGKEVCNGYANHYGASYDTVFCINGCQDGYKFCITHNSEEATFTGPNGYTKTMKGDINREVNDCGGTETHTIKCTEMNACFTDDFGDCGNYDKCKV